jgi:hypothetical protein
LSSILKALKKLEEESPSSQSFPSLPPRIDGKKTIRAGAKKQFSTRRLIVASVILLVVIVAAVALLSQGRFIIARIFPPASSDKNNQTAGGPSQNADKSGTTISSPSEKPAEKREKQTRQVRKQIKPTAPDRKVKGVTPEAGSTTPRTQIARQNTKAATAVRKRRPKTTAKPQKTIPKKPPIQRSPVAKKSVAGEKSVSNRPAPETRNPAPTRTYARINDPKLSLQALAWFQDASKRMVVINGRIVREGESVEGYQVTQIRREDVVVNDGRKTWSLEFRLKP